MDEKYRQIPDELLIHFVRKPQPVNQLLLSRYTNPSENTKKHFLALNDHLGEFVQADLLVIVSPPDSVL